jgi:hypothetical protein
MAAQDVGHRELAVGGGEQQRREEPGAGGLPERLVRAATSALVADAEQVRGGPSRALPGVRGGYRRPRRMGESGGSCRVEDEDLTDARPCGLGVVDDVGFDRRREHWALPFEDCRHDQPGALARLRRPDA